jgi:tetratricopeptide (TPR) repeat protein
MQSIIVKTLCLSFILLQLVIVKPTFAQAPNVSPGQQRLAELEVFFNQLDGRFVSEFVDLDAILEQSFKHVETSQQFRRDFTAGYKPKAASSLEQQMFGKIPEDGRVKLVKQTVRHNQSEGTYRFDYGDFGYGYIRFILQPGDNGDLKIVDWCDYAAGQRYTDSLANIIRTAAPRQGLSGKIVDLFSAQNNDTELLIKLAALIKAQDYHGIKKLFADYRAVFNKNWTLMANMVQAANLSEDENFYRSTLDAVSSHYGNDDRAAFLLIDYYFYRNDMEKVLQILERFSAIFDHNDSGLFLLKSNVFINANRFDEARLAAEQSVTLDENFEDGYWNLVTISLSTKDFAQTVTRLKELETRFGYLFSKDNFVDSEIYSEFVRSPNFNAWLE